MLDILSHVLAAVCGQNPGHTWAPGGMLLPCCQRCTGLYVGAGASGVLLLWLRPKLSGRFLEVHGAFLLAMAPFGFHWLAQGPMLRTVTGVLFGFAVVTFLWLPLQGRAGVPACPPPRRADDLGAAYVARWRATRRRDRRDTCPALGAIRRVALLPRSSERPWYSCRWPREGAGDSPDTCCRP